MLLEFPAPRGNIFFPLQSRCPQPIHSPRNLNHLNHLIFPTLVLKKRDQEGRLRRETIGILSQHGTQELVGVVIATGAHKEQLCALERAED